MAQDVQSSTQPRNRSADTALYDAVSRGLFAMLARGLRYAPDRDNIGEVAGLLTKDLAGAGMKDPDRVLAVLDKIGRTYQDWPATALVLRLCLPNREPMHKILPPPEDKPANDSVRRRNLTRMRQLLADARQPLPYPKDERQERYEAAVCERRERRATSRYYTADNLIEQIEAQGGDAKDLRDRLLTREVVSMGRGR